MRHTYEGGGSEYDVKCGRCQAPQSLEVKTSVCTPHPHTKPTCANLTHLSAGDGCRSQDIHMGQSLPSWPQKLSKVASMWTRCPCTEGEGRRVWPMP